MAKKSNPEPTGLTYEQARDELISVVQRLETGGGTLEETLALWERGELLAAECQGWLDGARKRLEKSEAEEPDSSPDESAED